MNENDLICEYYSNLERQGPGGPEITNKALSFIRLPEGAKISDIGCGTGGQTLVLAQNTNGHITAIDIFPNFIDILNNNAAKLNLQGKVKGIVGSMNKLPFQEEELDLIWSEGAIYNIGFEKGLNDWRKYLKPKGYIAVSEVTWLTENRPEELNKYWDQEYPQISGLANKIDIMEKAGYLPLACFVLPEKCWTDNYYIPQIPLIDFFIKKHKGNKMVENFIENIQHEIYMYNKYKEYFSYAFYIGQKI